MKLTRTLKLLIALAVASQLASWTMAAEKYGKSDKQTQGTSNLSKKEVNFINDAAEGGMMEVQMGQLAQQKGQSPDVKSLGQRLVTDHQKASDELKQLASNKGITVPSQLPPKHQKMIDKLSSASDFDKTFKDMAVKDHKKDIKEFERLSKSAEDQDLKAWVTKTLPTLQEHLRMAEQLGVTRTTSR